MILFLCLCSVAMQLRYLGQTDGLQTKGEREKKTNEMSFIFLVLLTFFCSTIGRGGGRWYGKGREGRLEGTQITG